jgi:hypothetical protein
MKGDKENKHNISIPQKSAVAIVPPKKVRTFRNTFNRRRRPPAGRPRSVGLLRSPAPASRMILTPSMPNRLSGRFTTMKRRIRKS